MSESKTVVSTVCPTCLVTDQIAHEDAFRHKAIAQAIANMILSEKESRAIALEGSWGSGKSTVVKILEDELCSTEGKDCETGVFIFDAWAHQGDPLRRSFLEKFIQWCNETKRWTKRTEHWKRTLNELARRYEEVKTKTSPTLRTEGTIIAALLLIAPFGLQVYQKYKWPEHPWFEAAGLLLSLAPVIFGLIIWLLWKVRNKENKTQFNAFAHIFYTSTATETFTESSRTPEPTSVEFEKHYRELLTEVLADKQRRIVLVMDNLDRVSHDYAKSIWSTLRVFLDPSLSNSHGWHNRVWVLVPYDPVAVNDLWYEKDSDQKPQQGNLSNHFLQKTFQATFRVPPIILSNWEQYLIAQLKIAFPRHAKDEPEIFHKIFRLYDQINGLNSAQVTPRNLKIFVNKVGALHRQWKDTIPLEQQAAFVMVADNQAEPLLSVLQQTDTVTGLRMSHTLGALLGADWPRNLAAIQFNVEPEFAYEALLDGPINKALRVGEGEALAELEKHLGFPAVFERIVEQRALNSTVDLEALARTAIAFSSLEGNWPGYDSCRSLLFKATTSLGEWQPFDEETAKGLGILVRFAPRGASLAPVIRGICSALNLQRSGTAETRLHGWCAGVAVVLPILLELDREAVVEHFAVQGDAEQYLSVIAEEHPSQEFNQLWEYMVPSAPRDEVLEALAARARDGKWDKKNADVVWALSRVAGEWNWKILMPSFQARIGNVQQSLPADVPNILDALYFLPWESDVRESLLEAAKNDILLLWLSLLIQNKKYRAATMCILPILASNLQVQPQQIYQQDMKIVRVQEGRQVLWSFFQNPDSNAPLIQQLSQDFEWWLSVDEWRKIAETHQERRAVIKKALKECLDLEDTEQIDVDELIEHIDFWREVAGSDFIEQLLTRKARSGDLSRAMMARPFSTDDGRLHLLALGEEENTNYIEFLKEHLRERTEEEWLKALGNETEMLDVALKLKSNGLVLGRAFQDALYLHAERMVADETEDELAEKWIDLTRLLETEDLSVLQHRIAALFKEQSKSVSWMILHCGSDLSDEILQDGPENYFEPIKAIIERHDSLEVGWLAGVLGQWKGRSKKVHAIRKDWADRVEECLQKEMPDNERAKLDGLLKTLRKTS